MASLTYKEAIAIYKATHLTHLRKTSTMPDVELQGIAKNSPHDFKGSNGITRGIIKHLTHCQAFANRINVSGRVIKGKDYTTATGAVIEGKSIRVKSTTKRGTPDLDVIFAGIPIKIEVKCSATRDKASPIQDKVKKQIEAAGGVYFTATSFEAFVEWWQEFTESKKA